MGKPSPARRRIVAGLAALASLLVPAIVGYQAGRGSGGNTTAERATSALLALEPASSRSAVDVDAIADAVDDAVVNITSVVEGGGIAAGTGIVIADSGLVLTNNHVIAGSTGLEVEFGVRGVTRRARVLGYSIVDDVALLQVQNASRLVAARLGSSASLAVGDPVVVLGNAGGRGGRPKVVAGTITALHQQITASDADGRTIQALDGLIRLAADLRSGDSGGPVVDERGRVVGMSVAASARNGFRLPGQSGGEGYAIPIEDALDIATRIATRKGGPGIRVGATRAVLGVQIQPDLAGVSRSRKLEMGGAPVVGVDPGSAADDAGLREGDVIVALGRRSVATSGDLIRALVRHAPGDTVTVTWRTPSGALRRGSVELGEGPPA